MNPMHDFGGYGVGLGIPLLVAPFVLVLILWSLAWKGLGLWHAAKRGEYWWFLAMLILNTAGILEIIYLFVFAKLKFGELFSSLTRKDTAPVTSEPKQ